MHKALDPIPGVGRQTEDVAEYLLILCSDVSYDCFNKELTGQTLGWTE